MFEAAQVFESLLPVKETRMQFLAFDSWLWPLPELAVVAFG